MKKIIFALGFFDGVHLGHRALLSECVRLAREEEAVPGAVTFDRHPKALFTPAPPPLINTTEDRITLLRRYGIREISVLPVNDNVMSTPWPLFLEQLCAQGAAGFVCGEDFRFGARGEGNSEKLLQYCAEHDLPCIIIPEQTVDGVRVSSTHIRSLLEEGRLEEANAFLGHPHILSGEVVPGQQLGRTIGIPTANLRLPKEVLVPKFGVYACLARFGTQLYPAVTNIGTRPTVSGSGITVEPWLLDFDGDLYGKQLTLEFHAFLRPERKFDSLEALRTEILKNAGETRKIFEKL